MTAEDLQCRDWILNNLSKTYEQVGDINLFEDKIYAGREENEWYEWELDSGEFLPIPITEAILDKNAFVPLYAVYTHWMLQDRFYQVKLVRHNECKWELSISTKDGGKCNMAIQYVHQLQHILKDFEIGIRIEL